MFSTFFDQDEEDEEDTESEEDSEVCIMYVNQISTKVIYSHWNLWPTFLLLNKVYKLFHFVHLSQQSCVSSTDINLSTWA